MGAPEKSPADPADGSTWPPLDDDLWNEAYAEFFGALTNGDFYGHTFEDEAGCTLAALTFEDGSLFFLDEEGEAACDSVFVPNPVDIREALRLSALLAAWADHAQALLNAPDLIEGEGA